MRRWLSILLAIAAAGVAVFFYVREPDEQTIARQKPEAPPDLEKLRGVYASGLDAIHRGDGADAVKHLSSFDFGKRAVEEYRLYYLANGYQLTNDRTRARTTLAKLWARTPKFVVWLDSGLNLGNLYSAIADWRHAGDTYAGVAARVQDSNVGGNARWSAIESRLAAGDVAATLYLARQLAIKNPRAPQADDAIAVIRSLTSVTPAQPIALTGDERLERALALLRDSDPQNAFEELTALNDASVSAALRPAVRLNRGIALGRLRRYEEANKILEPLTSGAFRFAIPAIYALSQNYRALAASINPMVNKVITVRQKVGVQKVAVGKGKKRRFVSKPKFGNVKKTIQLVDLAKKAKKDGYERLAVERLKDLLQLPLSEDVRIDVLNTLIGMAESKNQDAYEEQLVAQLVKVDPSQDAGLQHFWDKAWAAYARGDLNGARPQMEFLRDTYRNPNVKRAAAYWTARIDERLGRKEEAAATYRNLAQAPYDDIYAIESERRGAKRQVAVDNPLKGTGPDWSDIADKEMPQELRLAYELTALTDMRNAMLEIRANRKRQNTSYAEALLADLYNSTGNTQLAMMSLRRAFPGLATVEQDTVPRYFLAMYYPLRYRDEIVEYSRKNGLDPYLIMGLIHQESYYNPSAKSSAGATGLMQLMPATGKELAGRLGISPRLTDPKTNIRLGTAHFRMLVNLFGGNTELAIASYNAGQGRVAQWRRAAPGRPMDEFLESIPYRETRTYVKHVVMLGSSYRRMYP
ncbi:MAG: lytic transglycosylase domain-containing protein [Acidobacteriota bacterium]